MPTRREVAVAGHVAALDTLRVGLAHPSGAVRATALRGLARVGAIAEDDLVEALGDGDARVVSAAVQLSAGHFRNSAPIDAGLVALARSADDRRVEEAAWALGERHQQPEEGAGPHSARSDAASSTSGPLAGDLGDHREVERLAGVSALLVRIATEHADALCREAAVAALGAIGHPDGLRAVLAAMADKATVRRRAVISLAAFDGPERDRALALARNDRDWQVRQAAEDIMQAQGGG